MLEDVLGTFNCLHMNDSGREAFLLLGPFLLLSSLHHIVQHRLPWGAVGASKIHTPSLTDMSSTHSSLHNEHSVFIGNWVSHRPNMATKASSHAGCYLEKRLGLSWEKPSIGFSVVNNSFKGIWLFSDSILPTQWTSSSQTPRTRSQPSFDPDSQTLEFDPDQDCRREPSLEPRSGSNRF